MPLNETLIHTIKEKGPLSFHDFMEMALYYPDQGYYTCSGDRIGQNGDYYTSPEFTAVFGALLGRQIEEMWRLMGKKKFTIIEYGAGPGTLCSDILSYISYNPELYEQLRYCIIEKSPVMVEKEKQLLCDKAEWYDSIDHIDFEEACILSNEVLDNFAVHEVVMQEELMEVFVDYRNGFTEFLQPASKELKEYLAELNVVLPPGYRTEINLEALHWLKKNSDALQKGFLVTIDYGFPSEEFFSLSRCKGNLTCYQEHKEHHSLYESAGDHDITSHVNFSALYHWGRKFGLDCSGYTSQPHFLHGLGLVSLLDNIAKHIKGRNTDWIIELYRRIMHVSSKFNILIQHKNIPDPKLTGLQFAKLVV